MSSEFLRNEKRVDEVDGQRQGDHCAEPIIELHGSSLDGLLEAITSARVRDREREERDGHGNEDQVSHGARLGQHACHRCVFDTVEKGNPARESLFANCKTR